VKNCIQAVVRPVLIKNALARTYEDVLRNHTMQIAAALSYYFVLSLFPALIFLSAVVAYLPVPDLFGQALVPIYINADRFWQQISTCNRAAELGDDVEVFELES
jgi:uncharacterized BrkB/YihY/UPF0761 family membrane protein